MTGRFLQRTKPIVTHSPSYPFPNLVVQKTTLYKFHEGVKQDRHLFARKHHGNLFLELETNKTSIAKGKTAAKTIANVPLLSRLCFSLEEKFCVGSPFQARFNENLSSYVSNKKRVRAIRKCLLDEASNDSPKANQTRKAGEIKLCSLSIRKRAAMSDHVTNPILGDNKRVNLPPIHSIGREHQRRLVMVQSNMKESMSHPPLHRDFHVAEKIWCPDLFSVPSDNLMI